MLPRSLLHLLVGAVLCNAQYQQYFQPQYQPQQQPQYNFWQPQYDPSIYRPQQPPPLQYQPQFQQPPPVQYQNQGPPPPPPPPPQFNQAPPVYQPQFQPQIPQQFAPQPIQQNFAPQQQFQQQFQQPPPQFQQPPYQVNQSPPPPPPQPRPAPVQTKPFPQQPPQVFREQPVIYEQIVKILPQPSQPLQRPPPPPPPPQPTAQIIQIAAPPPPEKFVPYIADIYTGPSDTKPPVITVITPDENLPTGTYIAEEIVVDGNHPAYIENIEKLQPPPRKTTIQQKQSFVPPPQTKFKAPEIASQPRPRPQQPPPPPPPSPARPPVQSRPSQPTPAKSPAAAGSISGNSVNEVFLSCCKKRKVVKSCERICNFDILNKKTLTGMFLGTDPCPQSYGLDLLQCAAQDDDHTQCCIENGVHTTTAGNKCLGFCNMKPGVSFQADVSMLPCWGVLNDIKDCFRDFIEERIEG